MLHFAGSVYQFTITLLNKRGFGRNMKRNNQSNIVSPALVLSLLVLYFGYLTNSLASLPST